MTTPAADYDALIEPLRVHGSLYTDEQVFVEEMEKIWYRTWVYVGHVSEVPQPGDFVRKNIGPQDVILTRSSDGEINLLLNRCSHRGNKVCVQADGNANSFRCPYHGWNFRNDGTLIGYPHPAGYGGKGALDTTELGLAKVARVDQHEGFVFASMAAEGDTLAEHLGGAAGELTRLAQLSPEGEIEVTTGWVQHSAHANWKFLVENETDGYHPQFVHGAIFNISGSAIGGLYGEASPAVTRAFGHGHSENDLRPAFREQGEPMAWFGTTEDRVPAYSAAMRASYGTEADRIMIDGAPHVMVFPNLFIAEISLFVIQPIAHDHTIQHVTAVQLKGAPDVNHRMLQQCIGSVGPAGLLLADDAEMYERNQAGVEMRRPEWIDTRRGIEREQVDDAGCPIGWANDETGIRGFWQYYRELMTST
ncbi:aromatic ring-hydroxylating dioxygenase subunit alpha [uncultured Ilumatobacter sp.]|uniref:aromatic ring-hydroxylating oxygenase subunit alpha n=1 Tax=uncultured Ilumatobacter sp. TaxID=879968 RepID=UPI00374ED676